MAPKSVSRMNREGVDTIGGESLNETFARWSAESTAHAATLIVVAASSITNLICPVRMHAQRRLIPELTLRGRLRNLPPCLACLSCGLPSELLEGFEEVIQEGGSCSSSGSLFALMQQLLRDEFPKPQQRIGVLVPRRPTQSSIVEVHCPSSSSSSLLITFDKERRRES